MKRAGHSLWRSFSANADVLILFAALAFWQTLTRTPLTNRTAVAVALLCLVFRFLGAKPETAAAGPSAETETKRVFVEDSPAVLELSKLTGCDALRQLTPFIGKWMTISGEYEGMLESLQKDAIHLSLLLRDGRRMNLRFAVEYGSRLAGLVPGQKIETVCQIQQDGFVLAPENSELVWVEPLRRAARPSLTFA